MVLDVSVPASNQRRVRLLYVSLAALNLAALLGVAVGLYLGRMRYFGMALVALLAVALLDAIVFAAGESRTPVRFRTGPHADHVTVARDPRIATAALFASVFAFAVFGRGAVYFAAVAAFFSAVLVRVAYTDYDEQSVTFDLGLVVLGGVLVLASKSLGVAYYASTFDTIYHTTHARRIAAFETLAVMEPTRYDVLPLFHTVASVGLRATGLPPRTFVGVFFAVLYPLAAVTVFAVIRNVTDSPQLGLLSAAILSVNPAFLTWGAHSHAQSLSFVFLVTFLAVLSKTTLDRRHTAIAALVSVAWVMTHHLSFAMGVFLISVPVAAVSVWTLLSTIDIRILRPMIQRYVILVLVGVVYWTATGLLQHPVRWILRTSPAASVGVPTRNLLIQYYSEPLELLTAAVPFLLDSVHYAFFLALAGYGVWVAFRPGEHGSRWGAPLILFCFSVGALLYVPNPVWVPLRGLATLNRWGIMALPFIVLVPALGLRVVATERHGSLGTALVGVLVLALVFTSVGSGYADPSLADTAGYERGSQGYFTEEDLAAAAFVLDHSRESRVDASSLLPGYLSYTSWTTIDDDPPDRFTTVRVVDGDLSIRPGLTVVQQDALHNSRIKVLIEDPDPDIYPAGVSIYAPVSAEMIGWSEDLESVVYSDGGTVVVYRGGANGTAESRSG